MKVPVQSTALSFLISLTLAMATEAARPCAPPASKSDPLATALADLTIAVNGETRPIVGVRLRGLVTLGEAPLWDLLGGRPAGPLTAPEAAALVLAVRQTQLFATVAATLQVEGAGTLLDIAVTEHPVVRAVSIEGLVENAPGTLQSELLGVPEGEKDQCGSALPPREWLAREEGGEVRPGLLWRGLPAALDRVVERLFSKGYRMASLDGVLRTDGTLVVRVDEGRVESVEIRGVHPRIEADVRREMAIEPGRIYVENDARGAVRRLRERFPFLAPDETERQTRTQPKAAVAEQDGEVVFHTADAEPNRRTFEKTSVQVEGRKLIVHIHAWRGNAGVSTDDAEILHHTSATGYAPGLALRGWRWDPQDRVRALFAANVNVSVRHGDVEWLAGPKVQIPRLQIAELGVQVHDFSDTADRWRMSALDSYLDSMFGSGRRTDYFRRKGMSAFLTAHVDERLTAGVEYRLDRFGPPQGVLEDARQGSLILRGEWSSQRIPMSKVDGVWRHTETSLVAPEKGSHLRTGFRTVNTVEIAKPALGSDAGIDFVRVVSDSVLTLATGHNQGLSLRARFGGGDDVPAREQEALGGWSALRGYYHKELVGDRSWLATAEYRWERLAAFVDVGSVRQSGGWKNAAAGVGGKLYLFGDACLAAAWRTDGSDRRRLDLRLVLKPF